MKTISELAKQQKKSNDKGKAVIISTVLVLIIIVNVVVHLAANNSGFIQTLTVSDEILDISIQVQGYAIRDESTVSQADINKSSPLIKKSSSKVLSPLISDGDYVSYKEDLIQEFSSSSDLETYRQYQNVQNELDLLQKLKAKTSGTIDSDTINIEITSLLRQCSLLIDSGVIGDEDEKLISNFAYQISSINGVKNIDKAIESTQKQADALKNGVHIVSTIKSPSAGYFCNEVDGLEKSVEYAKAQNGEMTPQMLDKLLKKKPKADDEYLGKIIYQNNWYFSFNTSAEFAGEFLKRGRSVKVSFPNKGIEDLDMIISSKNRSGDKVCVTCRCPLVDADLLHIRNEEAIIVDQSLHGFKIANNAIVNVNGVMGVYVKLGNIAKFKPVKKLYGTDDFVLVSALDSADFVEMYSADKLLELIPELTKQQYEKSIAAVSDWNSSKGKNLLKQMYNYDSRVLVDFDKVITNGRNLSDGKFV